MYQSSNSFNVGASVGIGSTKDKQGNEKTTSKVTSSSLAFSNSLGYQRAKTLATLGNGNVTIQDKENSEKRGQVQLNIKPKKDKIT
ncbi:hypothetical protein [Arcobacter sp.]|uniref:hypothetical protein n=1 Tax=Arcobacter sp. TaxID=1872629 RepID=UPI003D10975C